MKFPFPSPAPFSSLDFRMPCHLLPDTSRTTHVESAAPTWHRAGHRRRRRRHVHRHRPRADVFRYAASEEHIRSSRQWIRWPPTAKWCSARCSSTMRTARSRTSGEKFADFFMAPSPSVGAFVNPGWFTRNCPGAARLGISGGSPCSIRAVLC